MDLILTNNKDLLFSVEVDDVGLSDHRMLRATLRLEEGTEQVTRTTNDFEALNFRGTVDWAALSEALSQVTWDERLLGKSANDMNIDIKKVLLEICKCLFHGKCSGRRMSQEIDEFSGEKGGDLERGCKRYWD